MNGPHLNPKGKQVYKEIKILLLVLTSWTQIQIVEKESLLRKEIV